MEQFLNLPTFLISLYLLRLLVTGANIGDAIVFLVLGVIYGGHCYLEYIREPEVNKDVKDKIKQLDEMVTNVNGKMNSLTLSSGFRK